MNGFMLFMLVVLAGQVSTAGPAAPPSLNPVLPASAIATPPPQTDYGWQINPKTNELEYIVQIAPETAEFMYKNGKERESEIPAFVAARISKVIVRFGSEPIQSTPTEQVLQLPVVNRSELASNLPNGNFKTLENGGPAGVQNVLGTNTPPPLTAGGLGTSLTDTATSLSDRMAEAVRDPDSLLAQNRGPGSLANSMPGSSFLDGASGRNNASPVPPGFPAAPSSPASGSLTGAMPGNPTGMPTSTATTPPSAGTGYGIGNTTGGSMLGGQQANSGHNNPLSLGQGTGTLGVGTIGAGTVGTGMNSNVPGYGYGTGAMANNNAYNNGTGSAYNPNSYGTSGVGTNSGMGMSGAGTGGYGAGGYGAGGYGQPNSTAPNAGAGVYAANNLPGSNYNTQNRGTGGFASQPLGANSPGWQNGYQQPTSGYQQPGSPYFNDPPSIRTADSRNTLPGTSGSHVLPASSSSRSSWDTQRGSGYTTDPYEDMNNQLAQRRGMETIMPVMFVLSLVVNFYLGMLIRKLLGRYRTLLASVRSQAV
jgi:hypothetical protein